MKFGLKNIDEPYRSILEEYFKLIKKYFRDYLVSFIVFGSVARGDARKDSDIDILIIVSKELPSSRLKRSYLLTSIEKELDPKLDNLIEEGFGITLSSTLKNIEEAKRISPLYLDMIEDAVIIYDKDSFFYNILKKLESKLKELGAERIWIGKKWYWKLKKDYKFGDEIIIE